MIEAGQGIAWISGAYRSMCGGMWRSVGMHGMNGRMMGDDPTTLHVHTTTTLSMTLYLLRGQQKEGRAGRGESKDDEILREDTWWSGSIKFLLWGSSPPTLVWRTAEEQQVTSSMGHPAAAAMALCRRGYFGGG